MKLLLKWWQQQLNEVVVMRNRVRFLFFLFILIMPYSASAILSMELTRGIAGAIPIAVVPFAAGEDVPQHVADIIATDLQNSGRFKVYGQQSLSSLKARLSIGETSTVGFPSEVGAVSNDYFRRLGTDNVVIGKVVPLLNDRYQITFQLLDIFRGTGKKSVTLGRSYTVSAHELRSIAHHISDLIYQKLTGIKGVFSTKLAYIVIRTEPDGRMRYILEVTDQDGYNPRPLLDSPEPIMSPAWSPNGRQLAYVSFEDRRASIYVQDVITGMRHLLSKFPGINGAPAWSPDGQKLALVLSKSGAPNIYVMDVASSRLTQLTHDFYINTEPAWSPNGKSLLFTSNRSGGPQIYQINLATGSISRLSYDGDYNARASYTRDGNHVVMIHRVSGIYYIGILDLDTGTMRVLNKSIGDSSSPSIAPNGSMILYDTVYRGRNILAMVSADGNVQLVLPAREGEAQDPAWSPFLS